MSHPTSLLAYLNKTNPSLELETLSSGSTRQSYTTSDDYPMPKDLRRWKEFNMKTIRRVFDTKISQYLGKQFENMPSHPTVDSESRKISEEPTLQSFIEKYNRCIVLEALKRTSKDLVSQSVSMETGKDAKVFYKKRKKPDFAGKSDMQGENNILPGDAKVSRNWTSEELPESLDDSALLGPLWPIRQVLHYCIECQVRYGYIISNKELVVLRVSTKEDVNPSASFSDIRGAVNDNGVVEWETIPWDHDDGSTGLTVNLALWVLHLLAANNGRLGLKYGKLKDEKLLELQAQKELVHSFSTNEQESQSQPLGTSGELPVGPENLPEDPVLMSFDNPAHSFSNSSEPTSAPSLRRNSKRKASTADGLDARKRLKPGEAISRLKKRKKSSNPL
jgi:hypothetical protein